MHTPNGPNHEGGMPRFVQGLITAMGAAVVNTNNAVAGTSQAAYHLTQTLREGNHRRDDDH